MTLRPAIAALLSLSLAACSAQPDPAMRDLGNAAFKGQRGPDGALAPVVSRTVMVGSGGATVAACPGLVHPRSVSIDVRWSAGSDDPAKARLAQGDNAYACEVDGDWTGIVFPASAQTTEDCLVTRRLPSARGYQGPCRWGWVRRSEVVAG